MKMDVVDNEVQEKPLQGNTPRRRKLAVAHQSNMFFDVNGNTKSIQRLNSMSETVPDVKSQWDASDENDNQERSSVAWENSVLKQIQSLIRNVQLSESLTECINKEIKNGADINTNLGSRTRRKSCFSFNNDTHCHTSRRQSVASLYQNKSKSLPRTNLNDEIINFFKPASQGTVHSNGRRISNAGQRQGRRSSVAYQHGGRRGSVVDSNVHITGSNYRRNSVVHLSRRRSSLAHAYQNSALHNFRRMSSVNDNLAAVPSNTVSQRRKSSVKPPCFPVTKLSSVQKRLHKIYNRRRRRQDRAEVKISDVRKAFKGLKNGECVNTSDSDDNVTNSNEFSSENEQEVSENMCIQENISPVFAHETVTESKIDTGDAVERVIDSAGEPKPNPRRKTSIQVRSWELSRKLRQRRREKRKGFTESDLI